MRFLSGFQSVGILIILIAIGYIISVLGKSDERINKFISWFVITITMPCNMFLNITKYFSGEDISGIYKAVIIPAIAMIISLVMGVVLVRLFKIRKDRAGTVIVLTALNNTIFMGLPINQTFFGGESTPFVLYYYLANTLLFWTVGVFVISGERVSLKNIKLKKIISPPLYGVLAGILVVVMGVGIPKMIHDTLSYLGNMTTGLSMIFIGSSLAAIGIRNVKLDKDVILASVARFVLGPAVSLIIFSLFQIDGLMYKVFVVQSFMPVMANQVFVAKEHGADSIFASEMVLVSTLMSLIVLPLVYMCI